MIKIREIVKFQDENDLLMLHQACLTEAWDTMASLLRFPTTYGLIGYKDAQPMAFILWQLTPPEAELLAIGVEADFRQQGIGQELIKRSIRCFLQRHIRELYLEVAAHNTGAIVFYEKMGFQITGRRNNYYYKDGKRSIDAILYRKNLCEQRDQ